MEESTFLDLTQGEDGYEIDRNNSFNSIKRVHENHNFGITPFGVFCFECKLPVGGAGVKINIEMIRRHNNRKKHSIPDAMNLNDIVESLSNTQKNLFSNITDFSPWIAKNNILIRKCLCGMTTMQQSNLVRHVKSMKQKDPSSYHKATPPINGFMSTCGRTLPASMINNTTGLSGVSTTCVTISSSKSLSTITNSSQDSTITTTKSTTSNNYIPLQSQNRKWLMITTDHIKRVFKDLKRVDESLDPYVPSLKLLFLGSGNDVLQELQSDLLFLDNIQKGPMSDDDQCLRFLLDCLSEWIKVYCREHVNVLQGDIRFSLQSHFDEATVPFQSYNLNFNMREKEDVIVREVKIIAMLIWKYIGQGLVSSELKNSIGFTIETIKSINKRHHGVVSPASVQDCIQSLSLQKLLHFVFIEKKNNAYSLLLGHRITITRLFFLKKSNKSNTNNQDIANRSLLIRSCGEFGSIVALHLHLYKLAAASLIACTEAISWPGILDEVKTSSLNHILSPLLHRVKAMGSTKIAARSKLVKDNGDICIDDFSFPKCKWSRLVIDIISSFDEILGMILLGDKWKLLVDLNNAINVRRIIDVNDEGNKDDLLHYDFNVMKNGKVVKERDLAFKKGIQASTFGRLTGVVMICLHGLGLGALRVSEIFRILLHQVEWKGGCLYYMSVSLKRQSSSTTNKKIVTHKLPPSISRYMLIYDYIGREFCKGREGFLFDGELETIGTGYKNSHFFNEFGRIFELNSNCTGVTMRQLYTSICNYVFPGSNNNFDKSTVSAVGMIAEMSGHSAGTHEGWYSSSVEKETFFNKYHQSLGENILLGQDRCIIEPLGLATDADVLDNLRVLFGVNADFLSVVQKGVVIDCCNNHTKHTFCNIGCGGGKSISWMIPALREYRNGSVPKLSIIVIPYCFLLDHHVNTAIGLVGQCTNVVVERLKGCDIDDNVLPNVLRDKGSLPSLLFLSLEAVAKIVEYHFDYLEELNNEGLVYKVHVDECHTLLSELNFRSKYEALGKIGGLNIPMVVYSGSFQTWFVSDFMKYMFGSQDLGMYNLYLDEELFGKKLLKIEHVACLGYIDKAVDSVVDYVVGNEELNVHVIVATVGEGEDMFMKLKNKKSDMESAFIYSGSEGQELVARKWAGNDIRVLISTTLGLVGNESSKTGLVCIVGMLYNLPSIVQSIGRIRPMRRTKNSRCSIFTAESYSDKMKAQRNVVLASCNQLIGCNVLSEENKGRYLQSMTMNAVNNWLFRDIGCRFVTLAKRLGFNQETRCGLCDKCVGTEVNKLSRVKKRGIDIAGIHRDMGIRLLDRLKHKCICCNDVRCSGTCVVEKRVKGMACYHCMGGHRASQCKKIYKTVLEGKACYSCFVFNYGQDSMHGFRDCSKDGGVKERLRALIQHDYLDKKMKRNDEDLWFSHLSGIYASEGSFFKFLYKYKDMK